MSVRIPKFRSPFNYDRDAASIASGLACRDPSLAVQSEKEDADINTIVARFGLTGTMPASVRVPQYGDFTGISDYKSALAIVQDANAAFMEMTAEVRKEFDNDPQKLMDFCSAESLSVADNLAKARKLGLVPKEAAVPAPLKVEVVNPAPPV